MRRWSRKRIEGIVLTQKWYVPFLRIPHAASHILHERNPSLSLIRVLQEIRAVENFLKIKLKKPRLTFSVILITDSEFLCRLMTLRQTGVKIPSFSFVDNKHFYFLSNLRDERMPTQKYPYKSLKIKVANTRLTAHLPRSSTSALVICKLRKSTTIQDTECPQRDQLSLNNAHTPISSLEGVFLARVTDAGISLLRVESSCMLILTLIRPWTRTLERIGWVWVCVVWWHLVSATAFGAMYVWPYFSKFANRQIRHQATHKSELSAWWLHVVILIFRRGLCGYVWVNIEGLMTSFQVFTVWYGIEWAFWWLSPKSCTRFHTTR